MSKLIADEVLDRAVEAFDDVYEAEYLATGATDNRRAAIKAAIKEALQADAREKGGAVPQRLLTELYGLAQGDLPDGDGVSVSVAMWANHWLYELTQPAQASEKDKPSAWTPLHGIPDWAIAKAYRDAVNRFDADSRGPSATIFASNVTVAADHAYREWSRQNRDLATDPQSLAEWLRVHYRGDFPTPELRWIHTLLAATHPQPVTPDEGMTHLPADMSRMTSRNLASLVDEPVTPAGGEVGYSEKFPTTGGWPRYPIGTRAHAIGGGYWLRVKDGWEWPGGSTFPTPGGDALSVSVPTHPPVADATLVESIAQAVATELYGEQPVAGSGNNSLTRSTQLPSIRKAIDAALNQRGGG